MRRLFPVTDETPHVPAVKGSTERSTGRSTERTAEPGGEWSLDALADAYAYPSDQEVWLRANMVSSLDGAAQHDGRSQPISSDTDMRIFGTLRGLADVIVVGAETVRLEGYRPARARAAFAERRKAAGQGPAPAIAVVSASLDLDFSLPLFASPLVPTLVLTGATAPQGRVRAAREAGAEVLIAGDGGRVETAKAVRALADRGLTRQLTEGGPRLLAQFIADGVLDELCLTVSPMLTAGRAQRIADGPGRELPDRFVLASILEEAGFLYTQYRRN